MKSLKLEFQKVTFVLLAILTFTCLSIGFNEIFGQNKVVIEWASQKNNDHNTFVGGSPDPQAKHVVILIEELITSSGNGKNTVIDENENKWCFDKFWKKDYIPSGKIEKPITSHWHDRNNFQFTNYKNCQELITENIHDSISGGITIQNDPLMNTFSHEIQFKIKIFDDVGSGDKGQ